MAGRDVPSLLMLRHERPRLHHLPRQPRPLVFQPCYVLSSRVDHGAWGFGLSVNEF